MYAKQHSQRQFVLLAWLIVTFLPHVAVPQEDRFIVEKVRERARQHELDRLQQEEQTQQHVQKTQSWFNRAEYVHRELAQTHDLAQHYFRRLDGLLDSDEGKLIARHGNHFNTFFLLKQYPTFTLEDIRSKIDEASSYVDQISKASQGPEVGYLPSQDICDGIEKLEAWSKSTYKTLSEDIATLGTLLRAATPDIDLANSETLAVVYQRELARRNQLRGSIRDLTIAEVKPDVIETHKKAFYTAEMEHASTTSDIMLREERQRNDQLRKESDMAILRLNADLETKLAKVQEDYNDAMALIEELKENRELARIIAQKEAQRERNKKRDEEQRRALIAEANSLRVQQLLGPLFEESYYQPLLPGGTDQKGPISISRLRDIGVFDTKTTRGKAMLLQVLTCPRDEYRTRWPCERYLDKLTMEQRDLLSEAHDYLIRLGPTLQQLGYLAR